MHLKLAVIPKPEEGTAAVFQDSSPTFPPRPLFHADDGDVDMLCGQCGFAIVKGVTSRNTIRGVLRCPSCQSYNQTPIPEWN